MKRSAACIALVATLALAANASAAQVYVGSGSEDPKVDVFFGVKKKPGKPRRVKAFTVVNIPFTCSNGDSGRTDPALPIEYPRRMKVNERHRFKGKRTFTVESTKGDFRITMAVRGRLRRGGKAKGALAISGPGPRPGVTCASGKVPWAAARVPSS